MSLPFDGAIRVVLRRPEDESRRGKSRKCRYLPQVDEMHRPKVQWTTESLSRTLRVETLDAVEGYWLVLATESECRLRSVMIRPGILLVGGHPLVAEMLSEHLRHDDRYGLERVQYCDDALALLHDRQIDLVFVLSLHVLWRRWPRGHSPARRSNLTNAILFLKHVRELHNPPPVILVSGSPLAAAAENEALAHGAFAFIAKPFDLAKFDRFVELALESRKVKPM